MQCLFGFCPTSTVCTLRADLLSVLPALGYNWECWLLPNLLAQVPSSAKHPLCLQSTSRNFLTASLCLADAMALLRYVDRCGPPLGTTSPVHQGVTCQAQLEHSTWQKGALESSSRCLQFALF